MTPKKPFSLDDLWTWFLRIVMGIVSILIYEVYSDLKFVMREMTEIKVMVAESKKDIQYLNENHKEFKDNTDRRLTFLEQKKL
jgi:hypothetical protein